MPDETVESGSEVENNQPNESSQQSSAEDASAGNPEYAKYVTYDENGEAIYTDPESNYQYVFDKEKYQWVPKDSEDYRWCTETNQWILKEKKNGDEKFADAVYKDGQYTYTDADGAEFFWDTEKKAWFPKIDDDFMAMYQTNYGFIDNTSESSTVQASTQNDKIEPAPEETATDESKAPTGKRKASNPQWFEESAEHCTKVYVSNLPDDITEEEFTEVMSKCGMIFRDPKTKKMKIKLYAEPNGQLKGDGLVHYIRVESVKLAIDMLDGYDVRGRKIKVQRAQFQMRGEYNPKLKPKRNKKDKEKEKQLQAKLLDWRPDKMRGEREKHERVVILKNMFEPNIFDNHVDLIIDYQKNVLEECSKCGKVKKVIVYSSEAEGVVEVRMSDAEEADLVVQMMNKRLFGERVLSAELWDGQTKYKLQETADENMKRLSNWDEFLAAEDDSDKTDTNVDNKKEEQGIEE